MHFATLLKIYKIYTYTLLHRPSFFHMRSFHKEFTFFNSIEKKRGLLIELFLTFSKTHV